MSRFGPLFQIERAGGQFVLAALQVPEEIDAVAAQVNALPEVAHNYRREHASTCGSCSPAPLAAEAAAACARIEAETGLHVFAFPKERGSSSTCDCRYDRSGLSPFDRAPIAATQAACRRAAAYDAVGAQLGLSAARSCATSQRMLQQGLVRRIGAVPNHYRSATPPTA